MENRGGTNPVFARVERETAKVQGYGASYKGITLKTSMLLLLVVLSGFGSILLLGPYPTAYTVLIFVAPIIAFIAVFIASFKPKAAPVSSVIYSLAEGVWLGSLTLFVSIAFPDFPVVFWAVLITIGIFIAMLVLYSTKLVVASSRFRRVMFGAMFSIMSVSLIALIVSLFDEGKLFYALFGNPNSPLVLLLSLLFLLYGAFMLVINFDNANMIVSSGADKEYEWIISLGLIVSIVYIYVQVIRILIIILSRVQSQE